MHECDIMTTCCSSAAADDNSCSSHSSCVAPTYHSISEIYPLPIPSIEITIPLAAVTLESVRLRWMSCARDSSTVGWASGRPCSHISAKPTNQSFIQAMALCSLSTMRVEHNDSPAWMLGERIVTQLSQSTLTARALQNVMYHAPPHCPNAIDRRLQNALIEDIPATSRGAPRMRRA